MSRKENPSLPEEEDRAHPTPGDFPDSESTTHQSTRHSLHPSSSSGLSDQNLSRRVSGSFWMPATPSPPLVRPSYSTSSTIHAPSAPPSPNTQAFQHILVAARDSPTSLSSPLHLHYTPPDPPSLDSLVQTVTLNTQIFSMTKTMTCLLLPPL